MRKTRQKSALSDVFESAHGPLGPQEVADAARRRVPTLGIATVYRGIKMLLEAGKLVPVTTPGGLRFEPSGREHHHHFFCTSCSKTYDIPGCIGGFERLVPSGFVVEQHEVTLSGRCSSCTDRLKGERLVESTSEIERRSSWP